MTHPIEDGWFTVERIDDSTFAISEYGHWEKVHSYLLLGERCAALIDTGIGSDDIKRITDRLTDMPVKVITTHVHWDHIGSHRSFREIYVHEAEKSWLTDGIPGLPLEQIRRDVGRDLTKPVPDTFDATAYVPFRGTPAGTLTDGQTIDLGGRELTVLHTPGHSPGHICILEKERGYLYTGDLLYRGTLYAFYPTTDPVLFAASIKKIHRLPGISEIWPGHHDLNVRPQLIADVCAAVCGLEEQGLVRHGTGVHRFDGFAIRF